jgi:hypothetical protein
MKGSQKIITAGIILVLGFCLGVIASIYLFAVEVDIPAIPYVNKAVKTNQDITLDQDGIILRLPKGSQFRLDRRSLSGDIYAIYFHVPLTDVTSASFEALSSKAKDFEVKSQKK